MSGGASSYRDSGRGEALLTFIERDAKQQGIRNLFALTTRTTHWFQERGFRLSQIGDLPIDRQRLYNYQRKSKVLLKEL